MCLGYKGKKHPQPYNSLFEVNQHHQMLHRGKIKPHCRHVTTWKAKVQKILQGGSQQKQLFIIQSL